jgi:hypothetical protein
VNFPFISSNIPPAPAYVVYHHNPYGTISQMTMNLFPFTHIYLSFIIEKTFSGLGVL